mgnify:CR=1 FL=1
MTVVSGADYNTLLERIKSRNRSTVGRRSGTMIDLYKARGTIIARCWPMHDTHDPSPLQQKATDSLIREREIEKYLNLDDVKALELRCNRSRYNWWEMLGKIVISREYNNPGSVPAWRVTQIKKYARDWHITVRTDKYVQYVVANVFKQADYSKLGHRWEMHTNREAGMETRERGREVFNPDFQTYQRYSFEGHTLFTIMIDRSKLAIGDYFILWFCSAWPFDSAIIGESGMYMFPGEYPWWVDCPLFV